jgi:hypothetical protein
LVIVYGKVLVFKKKDKNPPPGNIEVCQLEHDIIEVKWDRFSDQVKYSVFYKLWIYNNDQFYTRHSCTEFEWSKEIEGSYDKAIEKCTNCFRLENFGQKIYREQRYELEIIISAERDESTVESYERVILTYNLGIRKIDDLCSFLFVDLMLSERFDDIELYSKKFCLTGTANFLIFSFRFENRYPR